MRDGIRMNFSTADLHDEYFDVLQITEPLFAHFNGKHKFHGRISTLRVFEDVQLIKETLKQEGRGRVLVIDGKSSLRCALIEEKMAQKAIDKGWSGIIINVCIRDSEKIAHMSIGVKAISTSPVEPSSHGEGQKEIDLSFSGVSFHNGDSVYADSDGILICRQACELSLWWRKITC